MHNNGANKLGEQKLDLPEIHLGWDAATHRVTLRFETNEFLTWDMVLMVLEGARLNAADMRQAALERGRAQAALAAMHDQQLRNQLKL